jgi:hypothetical protein
MFAICCRKFFFLLISTFTLGVILALLITALVMGAKLQFFKTDKNLLPIFIAATVLSLLIFIFSVIVSCSQKRSFRIALSIIFIVFAITLLICGIIAIAREKDVIPGLEELWTGTSQPEKDLVEALQESFSCCGWNATPSGCERSSPCVEVIKPDVEKYWRGAAGALIGFAGLLLILGGIAYQCAYNEQATLDLESLDGLSFTYPSYPGTRPADSKELYKYTW